MTRLHVTLGDAPSPGRLAFVSFSGYQQQEVVVGLLSHSSDPPSVRQAALALFQRLAEDNTDALARYSAFLKVRNGEGGFALDAGMMGARWRFNFQADRASDMGILKLLWLETLPGHEYFNTDANL